MSAPDLDYKQTWDAPFNPQTARHITPIEFMKKFDLHKVLTECQHVFEPVKCPCCHKQLPEVCCHKCATVFCGESCAETGRKLEPSLNDKQVEQNHQRLRKDEESTTTFNSLSSVLGSDQINKRLSQGRGKRIIKPSTSPRATPTAMFVPHQVEAQVMKSVMEKTIENNAVKDSAQPETCDPHFDRSDQEDKFSSSLNKDHQRVETCQLDGFVKLDKNESVVLMISSDTIKEEQNVSETTDETSSDRTVSSDNQEDDTITRSLQRFAEQPLLQEYTNDKFDIVHVYTFNRVHIMRTELIKGYLLELIDEVNDVCLDCPTFEGDFVVGDLVCAPYDTGKGETMQRGIIVQQEQKEKYLIRLVEFGKTILVAKDKLKPLTAENLLKIPILGYGVKLRGVPDDSSLLLLKDFEEKLQLWMLERTITISEVSNIGNGMYEAIVSIDGQDVAKKILELQKWEWEKLFEAGLRDDLAINILWSQLPGLDASSTPIFPNIPPTPIKMKLSQFYPDDFVLTFRNIQLAEFVREWDVLNRQINRYLSMVSQSPFYPIIGESFFVQLDKKLVHGSPDIWLRAKRNDAEQFYCMDTGYFYDLKDYHHSFRAMCPEFLKVPAFAIKCTLSNFKKNDQLKKAVLQTLHSEIYYDVTILDFNAKTSLYRIRCNYDILQNHLSSQQQLVQ